MGSTKTGNSSKTKKSKHCHKAKTNKSEKAKPTGEVVGQAKRNKKTMRASPRPPSQQISQQEKVS